MVFKSVEWTPRACVADECMGACCTGGSACTNTTREACSGVWEGLGTTCASISCPGGICPNPFADADDDGDVDMADFAALQRCLTTGGGPVTPECKCFDRPESGLPGGNGLVDGNDVVLFLACGSGAGVPADPSCDGAP
jgi:hypothetical protein